MFPSNYFKAADLGGQTMQVVIESVASEEVGQSKEICPVVYFEGHPKALVLNRTNANVIAAAYGDDSDAWLGAEVVLYATTTTFQGRTVDAIRVRLAPPKRSAAPQRSVQTIRDEARVPSASVSQQRRMVPRQDDSAGPREFAPPAAYEDPNDELPPF